MKKACIYFSDMGINDLVTKIKNTYPNEYTFSMSRLISNKCSQKLIDIDRKKCM